MPKVRYTKLLKSLSGGSAKLALMGKPKREGFILNERGNWEYDHRQDIPYFKAEQLRLKLRGVYARLNEREVSLERELPEPRITIANATREQLVDALHKLRNKK